MLCCKQDLSINLSPDYMECSRIVNYDTNVSIVRADCTMLPNYESSSTFMSLCTGYADEDESPGINRAWINSNQQCVARTVRNVNNLYAIATCCQIIKPTPYPTRALIHLVL